MKYYLFILLIIYKPTNSQHRIYVDTGYLIRKCFDTNYMNVFFIKTQGQTLRSMEIDKIVEFLATLKDTALSFLSVNSNAFLKLNSGYPNKRFKVRNENEVLCLRGNYNSLIDRFKDEFFYIEFIPLIITYMKVGGLNNREPMNVQTYSIKCFGKEIVEFYWPPVGNYLLDIKNFNY